MATRADSWSEPRARLRDMLERIVAYHRQEIKELQGFDRYPAICLRVCAHPDPEPGAQLRRGGPNTRSLSLVTGIPALDRREQVIDAQALII